jgi:predicted transcriptional regulator with HTH domain
MKNLNPIVIHQHLIQKFMKQDKHFANLLALYTFYIYHAQLQNTNQPLATDEFTRKGLNWALERVKKTKRLLKDLGIIEVVQKKKYYYIHLFFIYTKKKITKILNKNIAEEKPKEVKINEEPKQKSEFEKLLIKSKINQTKIDTIRASILSIKGIEKYKFNPNILAKWIIYCEENSITYTKNNLKYWLDKLNDKSQIEQSEAIDKAIKRRWRDFYIALSNETKEPKYPHISLSVKEKILGAIKRF